LVVVAGGLLQTPDGREALARAIERLASVPGTTELRLGTIAPGLPARLEVDRVTVADSAGPWLEARELVLAWRPAALLRGRVHVDEIGLGRRGSRRGSHYR
jgi:translocation and assembly module TamB